MSEVNAIGISFGNSNSSIAYTTEGGKAEVIANEEGDRQIPSVLSYVDGEEFHGTQAKTQLVRNSKNTVAFFRELLGKDFGAIDPTPCHASAHPEKHDSTIAFSVKDTASDDANNITVSEITTRHLRRLVASASDYLGKEVNAAVITVPSNFTDDQKAALAKAAKEANVNVLQTISEPTAAVLAYDARPEAMVADKMVVVADIGGTRTDIAVIASRGGMYTILASIHDYASAGAQLDQVLIDHFAKEFMKKNKTDPRTNTRSLAKLKLEAEATKKALSIGGNASCSIESLADGVDFSSTINRSRYEMLASKVFGGFTRLIEEAVKKAGLDVLDIDEVILSGGTSHTPRIATNLASVFHKNTIILAPVTSPTAIDPATLSARGAAIQASLISQFEKEDIEQSTHPAVTVVPHVGSAIGVMVVSEDTARGIFQPLIQRETAAPCRRVGVFAVPREGGDIVVKICEGTQEIKETTTEKPQTNGAKAGGDEEADSDDDEEDEPEVIREKVWKIGTVLAEAAIKELKKGSKVEVTIDVSADMQMTVTAREVGSKGGVRGKVEAAQAP